MPIRDDIYEEAWAKLETHPTVLPILHILNKHDRGQPITPAEEETIRYFLQQGISNDTL